MISSPLETNLCASLSSEGFRGVLKQISGSENDLTGLPELLICILLKAMDKRTALYFGFRDRLWRSFGINSY